MAGGSLRPINARCCAQGVVNGTAEHGWGRRISGEFTSPHGGVNPPPHNPGYRVTYLPVDREGLLNLSDSKAAITDETAVVSLMVKSWAVKPVA